MSSAGRGGGSFKSESRISIQSSVPEGVGERRRSGGEAMGESPRRLGDVGSMFGVVLRKTKPQKSEVIGYTGTEGLQQVRTVNFQRHDTTGNLKLQRSTSVSAAHRGAVSKGVIRSPAPLPAAPPREKTKPEEDIEPTGVHNPPKLSSVASRSRGLQEEASFTEFQSSANRLRRRTESLEANPPMAEDSATKVVEPNHSTPKEDHVTVEKSSAGTDPTPSAAVAMKAEDTPETMLSGTEALPAPKRSPEEIPKVQDGNKTELSSPVTQQASNRQSCTVLKEMVSDPLGMEALLSPRVTEKLPTLQSSLQNPKSWISPTFTASMANLSPRVMISSTRVSARSFGELSRALDATREGTNEEKGHPKKEPSIHVTETLPSPKTTDESEPQPLPVKEKPAKISGSKRSKKPRDPERKKEKSKKSKNAKEPEVSVIQLSTDDEPPAPLSVSSEGKEEIADSPRILAKSKDKKEKDRKKDKSVDDPVEKKEKEKDKEPDKEKEKKKSKKDKDRKSKRKERRNKDSGESGLSEEGVREESPDATSLTSPAPTTTAKKEPSHSKRHSHHHHHHHHHPTGRNGRSGRSTEYAGVSSLSDTTTTAATSSAEEDSVNAAQSAEDSPAVKVSLTTESQPASRSELASSSQRKRYEGGRRSGSSIRRHASIRKSGSSGTKTLKGLPQSTSSSGLDSASTSSFAKSNQSSAASFFGSFYAHRVKIMENESDDDSDSAEDAH